MEKQSWQSELELSRFINKAIYLNIDAIYAITTQQKPFSVFLDNIENARENFDKFCTQLNRKLTNSENWKAIEMDIKDRFSPMINNYINWYAEHKTEFEKFQHDCPYTLMLSIIESTKKEILKYFPDY